MFIIREIISKKDNSRYFQLGIFVKVLKKYELSFIDSVVFEYLKSYCVSFKATNYTKTYYLALNMPLTEVTLINRGGVLCEMKKN